jgi:hypothetical protein
MKLPSPTSTVLMLALGAFWLLPACSNTPKVPDWQLESKSAMDRSVAAYLRGDSRIETAELTRARSHLSSTGRVDLVARVELLHCAARVASLVFETCAGFDALRADAPEALQAYADYLRGQIAPAEMALLPSSQQGAASRTVDADKPLDGIDDPLSLLVAAGVLLESGRASPAVIAQAVETASGQGWRRPLLAWLGVQAQRASLAGQTVEAQRLQRRIKLVQNETPPIK